MFVCVCVSVHACMHVCVCVCFGLCTILTNVPSTTSKDDPSVPEGWEL